MIGYFAIGQFNLHLCSNFLLYSKLTQIISLSRISDEKLKENLKLESSQIVSIELLADEMLIGFSGGTVLIAKPQPIPLQQTIEEQPKEAATSAPEDIKEDKVHVDEEKKTDVKENKPVEEENKHEEIKTEGEATTEENKPEEGKTEEAEKVVEGEEKKKRTTGGFDKKHLQVMKAEATKKFRTLSRTMRNTLLDKEEDVSS